MVLIIILLKIILIAVLRIKKERFSVAILGSGTVVANKKKKDLKSFILG